MHFCTRQTNQPKQCFGNLHWHCPFFFLEIKIYKIWLSCLAIYYTIEIIPGARKLLLNCYFNLFWTSLQNTNLFAFHLELLINFTQLVCKPLRNLNTVIINISLFHFLCNLVNWFSPLKTVKKMNIVFIWTLTGLIHSYFVLRPLPWKKNHKLFGKIIHYLHFISVTSYSGEEYRRVRVFDSKLFTGCGSKWFCLPSSLKPI